MARRVIELMDDMHLSSKDTFLDYYYAMQANNVSQASNILVQNPSLSNQIITADNINILLNETYRRELQPKVDIDYFLDGLNAVFEKMISYTRVRGEWDKNTQYDVHNLVYYRDKGYFVYTNEAPPIGTLPTDTKYWLEYDIRGLKGYGGFKNINYLGVWNNSIGYNIGDAVAYKNKLWWAIANNTNTAPNLNHYPWVLIAAPDVASKTPIQKQTPTGYNIGDFWWQITKGDDIIQTTWITKASDPVPRFASASFMIGNNIYVVGGQDRTITASNVNEAYDTITNTWSRKANYPTKIDGAYGFSINNVGYCAGGLTENNIPVTNAYSYNPTTNIWTSITPLPQPMATVNTTTTIGNYAYTMGGLLAGGMLTPNCYRFDPSDLSWTKITEMPKFRYAPAVEHVGNKIYVIGGSDSLGNYYSDTQIYDITTNTWSTGTSMLSARGFCGSFEHRGEIYVIGGGNDSEYSTNVNEVYNTRTNTWRNDIPMQYKRNSLVGQSTSTKGYAIGGINIIRVELNGYVEEYQFVVDESTFEMVINTNISNNIITEDNKDIITENNLNIVRENDINITGSKTVSIPMVQGGNYNYYVDWGDGTTSTQITTYNDPQATHTYSSDGEYTIKLIGNLDQLKFTGNIAADLQKVTKCKLNFSSIESMFKNCINLNFIPDDIFDKSINITSAKDVFNGCQNLSIIPVGLFDNNVNITTFEGTFKGTSISIIPNGIFNPTQKVTSFKSTFENCSYLSNIPTKLFDSNISVSTFNSVFKECQNLKSIPNNLFINNPIVVDYSYAFEGCSSLTSLPSNLFGNASVSVNNFSYMFANTGLTTLPTGLFENAVAATNYNYVFNNTRITSIPTNCFNGSNASSVNSFNKNKLVDIKDNGLNGLLIDDGYFENCTSLINVGDNIISETFSPIRLFNGCISLRTIGNMNFSQAKGTDRTFSNCKNLMNLEGFKNSKGEPTISKDFNISDSSKLTKQSLLNISDSLVPQTSSTIKTLFLSDESLALLTDVEKLVIINKYWNLNGYTPNITEQIAKDLVLELKGSPGLTANIVETTSLYYYVNLVNTDASENVGRYVVDKAIGYVYDYDNAPEYEYNIKISTDGVTYKEYWLPKGADGDSDTTILRNKLVELNRATPIDGIDIGDENSKAYHTGFAGAQNLNNLCSDFSKLREFYIYDSTDALPTSMSSMFANCYKLTTVNFDNINTSNVTSMEYMFFFDSNLKTIKGLENADTSNVLSMRQMFSGCSTLVNSDLAFLTKWSNSKCTDMGFMFSGVSEITSMINIKMPNVENASSMYSGTGLTSITGNLLGQKIQDASFIFSDCSSLKTLPSDYKTIFGNNSSLEDVSYAFANCTSLKVKLDNDPLSYNQDGTITIDETKRNNQIFRNCPNLKNASYLFSGCTGITDLPVFVFWYNTKLTTVAGAFLNCSNMSFKAPETGAEAVLLHNNTELQDISLLFQGCKNIISFVSTTGYWGYGAYDTLTKLTNISGLFKNSGADSMLFDIGLPKNSPNITNISEVYSGCKSVTSLPFGTEVVTNMPKLQNCSKICYDCTNINQFGDETGDKVYANDVIYPIAQLSTLTKYEDAFTNCTNLTDYANLPMGWRNGNTKIQNPNNIAIALAKVAWGANSSNYTWTVSSTSGNEYTVQCKATGSTALTATYIVNVQTGKVVKQ